MNELTAAVNKFAKLVGFSLSIILTAIYAGFELINSIVNATVDSLIAVGIVVADRSGMDAGQIFRIVAQGREAWGDMKDIGSGINEIVPALEVVAIVAGAAAVVLSIRGARMLLRLVPWLSLG